MSTGVKVRNYLVDDPVNRDWVKLLLVLEARGTKGGFATIDDRVVFMGGAGAGGGGASGTSSFAKAATTGHATKVQGLGGGVCQAELISYEDDGQGVWKATDAANGHDGRNEVAAYGLNQLLGGDEVPETVFSPGPDGKPGTSQQFVADGITALKYELDNRQDATATFINTHRDQVERIVALDFMIGNNDRHDQNFLLSESRGVVAIDHGHATWRWMNLPGNELLQWANERREAGTGTGSTAAKQKGRFAFSEHNLHAWERITAGEVERVLESAGVPMDNAVGAFNRLQYLIETGEMTW